MVKGKAKNSKDILNWGEGNGGWDRDKGEGEGRETTNWKNRKSHQYQRVSLNKDPGVSGSPRDAAAQVGCSGAEDAVRSAMTRPSSDRSSQENQLHLQHQSLESRWKGECRIQERNDGQKQQNQPTCP